MEYRLTITGDENDADYVTEITKISQEDLDLLMPLFKQIKKYTDENPRKNNFPNSNWKTETWTDLYDFPEEMNDIVFSVFPGNEDGIHSVESIKISPWVEETELL